MIIGVDCDDVLIHTTPFFVNAYNEKYGTQATLAHLHGATASSADKWGAEPDEVIERLAQLTESEEYKLLSVDPMAIMVLKELAKSHDLHLITARKESERVFTTEVLNRNLEGIFTSPEFVGWEGSKGQVCQHLKVDVLIDDSLRHLVNARECGVEHLIWFGDYEWQTPVETMPPGVVRCTTWIQVENEIRQITQRK